MPTKSIKRNAKKKTKAKLHPRNKHQGRYNLQELSIKNPDLKSFIFVNDHEIETLDFADPEAVKALNKALLLHYYGIKNWEIPQGYLCPPIPGRADYIHNIADLLATSNKGIIPKGKQVKCLDIGIGANCVYPLIGNSEYGWSFVGADIDETAIASSQKIVVANPQLDGKIKFRHQPNNKNVFVGVLELTERFHVTICNPPFYASMAEAQAKAAKKLSNLGKEKAEEVVANFGGKSKEVWCYGGEGKFVNTMIEQSKTYANSCLWFTTLISNIAHLDAAYKQLDYAGAFDIKILPMGQGSKVSRVLAWTFQTKEKQEAWMSTLQVTEK
ncbi:23S rRNA (adenine(1618)-N(6))-methyltransferase RlmF [Pedobacter sp. SD-b]|uniref:Ribosomal RNA large subunit methyltransferase F n=1 Tax=Pedobacter segetis TaxID=2793069 RepID=A0ABS1BHR4_9SPHI|nr:23S rRNA (adenine(1618)-N(6))-methyltransferase RlmF [Pedobacter segetis]MBK0381744.1 23S rRNA (adenine(1618)-N(6))-methyltransferase RlmF [Pedobacter segetis]